jgi:hypothetical protein
MAVEKSKVIARLKALFPKANLSQKRLDALADKLASKPADDADDAAIDAVINDFNSILSIEDIAREDDRLRTLEAKHKEPAPPTPPTPPTPPNPEPPKGDEVPSWVQGIVDSNKKLLEEVEAIKTGKIVETKKQTASELFAKSEVLKRIPEGIRQNWVNRIDVNSETPFEEQIQALETEYSTLVQETANSNSYPGPAGGGNPPSTVDEKLVDDIVSSM